MTPPPAGPVRPFTIEIPEATLADLQRRLAATRLPEFPLADPDLGLDSGIVARLLEHWRERFDWRAVERRLNGFDHVQVEVDGMDVHAVHVRGEGPAPLPLLVSHGWPSSFAEILPAVDLMTHPGDHGGDPADAFDVVIASLPGYAFSAPPIELADSGAQRMAQRFHGLMTSLGYERYGASGGDIAARVAAWIGALATGRDRRPAPQLQCDLGARRAGRAGRERGGRVAGARGRMVGRRWRLRAHPAHPTPNARGRAQ